MLSSGIDANIEQQHSFIKLVHFGTTYICTCFICIDFFSYPQDFARKSSGLLIKNLASFFVPSIVRSSLAVMQTKLMYIVKNVN